MTTQPDPARAVRRRRMHERQAVVFGLLIAALAVTGLGALAVYTGAIEAPFDRPFSTPEETDELADVPVPCLPDGTLPVPSGDVHVVVLNASGESEPLAGLNKDVLVQRGFVVDSIGNAPDVDGDTEPDVKARTQIHFGAAGLAAAYTLAAHYPDPGLVLDAREDATVTLYVGQDFEDVVDNELVGIAADVPLESREGCVPVEQITPQPLPVAPGQEAPAEG
ncbi:LytR C-terminal domain-containing protein [Cellulosimicrobium cellulans]|uniref:LytR C-terminal domain-containing protein n=1 Tax=Cellulosimicrobium cellulans TaxID=1710 RepID=UPI000B1438C2|nr:LytR C-terminal domain-containing protein [Cellulosimicrobium cellulans]